MSLFDFGPLTGAGLFKGKVLDATECNVLFKNVENPPPIDVFGQFSSVVGASKEFYQRLKASSLEGCRVTAFPSPAGRTLLCIAVQLDEFQSRLLFDLKLPRTRQMLKAAKKSGEIRFLYFLDGGSEALSCGVGIAAGVVDDPLRLLSLETPTLCLMERYWPKSLSRFIY